MTGPVLAGGVGTVVSMVALPILVYQRSGSPPRLIGLLHALSSMAGQVSIVNGITYRQQVIPDDLQSRVNVIARMIAIGGTPLGAVAGGLMTEAWSVPAAFVAAAAVLAVTAAAGYVALRAAAPSRWRHLGGDGEAVPGYREVKSSPWLRRATRGGGWGPEPAVASWPSWARGRPARRWSARTRPF